MAYNSGKLVKDVNVGDIIMTNTTGRARIKYIVKFKPKQRIDLCHIGYKEGIDEGFLITPWHPIKD